MLAKYKFEDCISSKRLIYTPLLSSTLSIHLQPVYGVHLNNKSDEWSHSKTTHHFKFENYQHLDKWFLNGCLRISHG